MITSFFLTKPTWIVQRVIKPEASLSRVNHLIYFNPHCMRAWLSEDLFPNCMFFEEVQDLLVGMVGVCVVNCTDVTAPIFVAKLKH